MTATKYITKEARYMANKSELSVKVNVDVSEALTGLKALQREAKKATAALRELEAADKAVSERSAWRDAARE